MEKKIFIINKSSHDYSEAEKFGKLVYMTSGSISRFAVSKMNRLFELSLEDSNKDDYLLISGMNIMCSIACGFFAAKHKRLNLLIYDKNSSEYKEKIIIF